MPTNDFAIGLLDHIRWAEPITPYDLRQALGDETLVPRLTEDCSAYELLDHIAAIIEREPACFNPDVLLCTPERDTNTVWCQQPAHGVVASIYGWLILMTRGSHRPSDIERLCSTTRGIVAVASDILGFWWDEDEDALEALLGYSALKDVRERAAEAVERIRRFQATHEDRLRWRYVFTDAAQLAVEKPKKTQPPTFFACL